MADYRSILNRAISGLPENTEEARRTIYDKARSALMRQLSSLEPALSPAEISKQRLQLEEAVRDTENQYNGTAQLEGSVADALSEAGADIVEHEAPAAHEPPKSIATNEPGLPDSEQEAEPQAMAESTTAKPVEKVPPMSTPDLPPAIPKAQAAPKQPMPAPPLPPTMPALEDVAPVRKAPDIPPTLSESEDVIRAVDRPSPLDAHTPAIRSEKPDALKGQKLVDEAEASHARVDAMRAEKSSALDELKETMAEDGVPVMTPPKISVEPRTGPSSKKARGNIAPPMDEPIVEFETANRSTSPSIDATGDDAALIAAATRKPGGKGLIWIFILLIIFGVAAFGWAQRDVFEPALQPLYEKAEQNIRDLLNLARGSDESKISATTPENNAPASGGPEKSEDRILDTPLESAQEVTEQSSPPVITPGNRIVLPDATSPAGVPVATPSPVTPSAPTPAEPSATQPDFTPPPTTGDTRPVPDVNAPNTTAQTITPAPQTTTVTNIFTSSAILYEERKDSGRPDVSTGNVVWEFLPTGSEAIGSKGLPSVRGNARIQNRDLRVRFEVMRNLDESLPASHLIEMEFETGPLFADDGINNVAGVLMKEKEQDNGQQLAGAVVKVSDTVFWIAMSARAADLASNVDALKKQSWFDIPIIFKSGKRALLTLEKGAAGTKAIEDAFAGWEKNSPN